jgi:hypothetical protein
LQDYEKNYVTDNVTSDRMRSEVVVRDDVQSIRRGAPSATARLRGIVPMLKNLVTSLLIPFAELLHTIKFNSNRGKACFHIGTSIVKKIDRPEARGYTRLSASRQGEPMSADATRLPSGTVQADPGVSVRGNHVAKMR